MAAHVKSLAQEKLHVIALLGIPVPIAPNQFVITTHASTVVLAPSPRPEPPIARASRGIVVMIAPSTAADQTRVTTVVLATSDPTAV